MFQEGQQSLGGNFRGVGEVVLAHYYSTKGPGFTSRFGDMSSQDSPGSKNVSSQNVESRQDSMPETHSLGMNIMGQLTSTRLDKVLPAVVAKEELIEEGKRTVKPTFRGTREVSTRLRLLEMDKDKEQAHENNLMKLKGKKLNRAILILLMFFAFGVVFYHIYEDMAILDALYYTVLTISTVGYGDLVPKTQEGRLVTCIFVFAGLALIAEAIGIVSDYVLERMNLVAQKVAEEAQIREKELALKKANEDKLKSAESSLDIVMKAKTGIDSKKSTMKGKKGKDGNLAKQKSVRNKASAALGTLVSGIVAVNKVRTATLLKQPDNGTGRGTRNNSTSGKAPTPQEIMAEEQMLEEEENRKNISRLWYSLLYIALSVVTGTVFYALVEGPGSCPQVEESAMNESGSEIAKSCFEKSWVDAFYMSCITVTSVGYGDVKPSTDAGKAFGIVWILSGTVLVGKAIGNYLDFQTNIKQKELRTRILAKPLTLEEVEMADIDDSKSLSEAEFVLYKLQAMGILLTSDVEKVNRKFRMELAVGDSDEVHIPTAEHVETCIKDGRDFNFAMRSYQKIVMKTEKAKIMEKKVHEATAILDKKKLGHYSGALYKIKRLIDECGGEALKAKINEDDYFQSLPAVENSQEEITRELKRIDFDEAQLKLKKMKASKKSEDELAIDRKLSVSGFAKKMIRRASESRSARNHADNDEGVDDAPSSTTPETVKSTGSQINT